MKLWYISFTTKEKFIAATVVSALDEEDAMAVATQLEVNPGGFAMIIEIPESQRDEFLWMLNQLYGRNELLSNGFVEYGTLSKDKQEIIDDNVAYVPSDQNKVKQN